MRGLELARRIPTGIVHINDQTVDDEPNIPFGGIFDSGTGTRFGGTANLEAFTETRWVTDPGRHRPVPVLARRMTCNTQQLPQRGGPIRWRVFAIGPAARGPRGVRGVVPAGTTAGW